MHTLTHGTHSRTFTHVCMHSHTHSHTCAHSHMHTHLHIHTHAHSPWAGTSPSLQHGQAPRPMQSLPLRRLPLRRLRKAAGLRSGLLPGAGNGHSVCGVTTGVLFQLPCALTTKPPVKLNKITNFTVDFPPALLGSLPLPACLHALQATVSDQTSSRVLHRGNLSQAGLPSHQWFQHLPRLGAVSALGNPAVGLLRTEGRLLPARSTGQRCSVCCGPRSPCTRHMRAHFTSQTARCFLL